MPLGAFPDAPIRPPRMSARPRRPGRAALGTAPIRPPRMRKRGRSPLGRGPGVKKPLDPARSLLVGGLIKAPRPFNGLKQPDERSGPRLDRIGAFAAWALTSPGAQAALSARGPGEHAAWRPRSARLASSMPNCSPGAGRSHAAGNTGTPHTDGDGWAAGRCR